MPLMHLDLYEDGRSWEPRMAGLLIIPYHFQVGYYWIGLF